VRERDVERALIKRVKQMGGEVRKLAWIGRRGAPDRLVMLPERYLFVELKAPGGRLSRLQDLEHRRLRAAGFDVRVIWKLEDIDEVLA
jgi:hypothetical protein